MRWGLGPVFACESVLAARRREVYAGRSAFVLLLLIGMAVVWLGQGWGPLRLNGRSLTFQKMANIGRGFFYALTAIQLTLVLLAAPAAAAGAICTDRARGTLAHMMVTDLSDAEIVAGKLAARLVPVVGLIACGVPVAALAGLLGGVDFGALAGSFAVSIALAALGCALALALSVRASRTHEVLMAVYVLEGLGLLTLPIWSVMARGATGYSPPDWVEKANPYVLVFAPYLRPGFVGALDYAAFVGVALAIAAALAGVSAARLRRAVLADPTRAAGSTWRGRLGRMRLVPAWAGPSLDGNPVLWREWHRSRPSPLGRRVGAGLFVLTWTMAAWGIYQLVYRGASSGGQALGGAVSLQLLFGMLMISAAAPTALAEERIRGSLDVLLSTPLTTASIVAAKWWGMFRRVLWLVPLPTLMAAVVAATEPTTPRMPAGARLPRPPVALTVADRVLAVVACPADLLASGAVIVSLGLALATWVPRLGRAIAVSVTAYILSAIGWVVLVEFSFATIASYGGFSRLLDDQWLMLALSGLSPLAGPLNPITQLRRFTLEPRGPFWVATGVVLALKLAIAGLLFLATVRTFDRCLGRLPESGRRT